MFANFHAFCKNTKLGGILSFRNMLKYRRMMSFSDDCFG